MLHHLSRAARFLAIALAALLVTAVAIWRGAPRALVLSCWVGSLCLMLGLFNYHQTTQIILSSSEKLFERIEQDVRLDMSATYQPIRHLLSLLADNPATQGTHLEQRLPLLRPFSQSLSDNPNLASLYLGYANGDFFMVRPLRSAALKTLQFDCASSQQKASGVS